jgi:hypothetical protein
LICASAQECQISNSFKLTFKKNEYSAG